MIAVQSAWMGNKKSRQHFGSKTLSEGRYLENVTGVERKILN
jgi:hypothetical protein